MVSDPALPAHSAPRRLWAHLRSHGLAATGSRLAGEAARLATRAAYLHETHVWYELALGATPRAEPWPAGVDLVRGGTEQLPLLAELDTINAVEAAGRLADDAQWWLVVEAGRPLFSCWIFRRRAPVLAAPTGWLPLPDRYVVLEDSVTAAAARGRGIAPRAWSAIADTLAAHADLMITKVAVDNIASRRAVGKAGFAEFAVVDYWRVMGRRRVRVRPAGAVAGWLATAIGSGPVPARQHP